MFGIADNILIAWFDDIGRDHDATVDKVLRICRQANLKLNKDKYTYPGVQAYHCLGRLYHDQG